MSNKKDKNISSLSKVTDLDAYHIIDLFLQQLVTYPDRIAAIDKTENITYKQLYLRAAALSSTFSSHRTTSGDRIVILCDRNIDGLIAIMATYLSNCIYVPISPEYPEARVNFIINDCDCRLAIVANQYRNRIRDGINIISLQEFALSKNHKMIPMDNDLINKKHSDLNETAYILYTSGTTGRPKGVVVSHIAVMNTLRWMKDAFFIKSNMKIPQKTPWGFTDSIWEIFLPLITGASIVFIDENDIRNPLALYRSLKSNECVITQFVPPALSVFLDVISNEIEEPDLPKLKWVLNGGEELPRNLVDRWFSTFPNVGYANTYGMTESAIYASCFFMKEQPLWGMRRIPIGKPISNAEVLVLDRSGKSANCEQIGEICVGGRSLMTGYWKRPNLTSKAFIPHPQTGNPLYRTGDIGYLRFDGNIAFIGRQDHQVKIRGMRVELGEIESALMQNSSINQAVVIIKGKGEAKLLTAFYTIYKTDPGEDSILEFLSQLLPDYMIPSRCIKLDSLPITGHNKTDREKLSQLSIPDRHHKEMQMPKIDSIEETIWNIWASVLGHKDFGIDDGFFSVGGNSLLLINVYTKLDAEIRDVFDIPDLIQYPTIRLLTAEIDKSKSNNMMNDMLDNRKTRRNPVRLNQIRAKRRKKN